SVGIFPIRYTAPEPIITELEKIMDSGEGGLSQNTVKFQPVARLNAVLVVARKPEILRSVETWIKRLDAADTSSARAGVHVYHVKYGEARQLARVLNDIFVGGGGAFETPAGQVAPRGGLGITSSQDRLSPQAPSASANVSFGGSIGGSGAVSGGGGGLGGGARIGGACGGGGGEGAGAGGGAGL